MRCAAVAERLGAPVVTTFNGKGALDEDHPLSGGAGLHRRPVHELVGETRRAARRRQRARARRPLGGAAAATGRGRAHRRRPGAARDQRRARGGRGGRRGPRAAGPARRGSATAPGDAEPGRAARWAERLRADAREAGARWDWLLDAIGAALGRTGVLAGDSTMVCYYGAAARVRRHVPRSFLFPTGFGTLGYGLPGGDRREARAAGRARARAARRRRDHVHAAASSPRPRRSGSRCPSWSSTTPATARSATRCSARGDAPLGGRHRAARLRRGRRAGSAATPCTSRTRARSRTRSRRRSPPTGRRSSTSPAPDDARSAPGALAVGKAAHGAAFPTSSPAPTASRRASGR